MLRSCGPSHLLHGSYSFLTGVIPNSSATREQRPCQASQPQTTAIFRATGMRENRYGDSCGPVSHPLFGFLSVKEHFKLSLMFENVFRQTSVGSRGCFRRWKIRPVLSSASQPSCADWDWCSSSASPNSCF